MGTSVVKSFGWLLLHICTGAPPHVSQLSSRGLTSRWQWLVSCWHRLLWRCCNEPLVCPPHTLCLVLIIARSPLFRQHAVQEQYNALCRRQCHQRFAVLQTAYWSFNMSSSIICNQNCLIKYKFNFKVMMNYFYSVCIFSFKNISKFIYCSFHTMDDITKSTWSAALS